MKTWETFAASAPDFANVVRERLAGRISYLATIRADGSPRVHPVVPHIARGRLFVYMGPDSPKVRDLRRDPRYAMHCSVEDISGGNGEVSLRGQALIIEDSHERAALFEAATASGFHPENDYVLFELNIESVLSIAYANGPPMRQSWGIGI